METDRLRATVVGFLAAGAVFAVLAYTLDAGRVATAVGRASPGLVAAVVGVILLWLFAWGVALRTVLGVLGERLAPQTAFLVFSGAMFANNVTPFGQAGGEPVTALLISKVADTEYERSLAAIASVDTLNFFPSIGLALLGAAYYATRVTLPRRLQAATGVAVLLAVAVPVGGYTVWRRRETLSAVLVDRLVPAVGWLAGVVPRLSVPSPASVADRIDQFFGTVERIATDPRGLVVALAASSLGWFCQMVGLWLAFRALGEPVGFVVVMFAVPMGAIAGATPTPGGSGFVETALIGVLSLVVSVPTATVGAAVIVFRAAVYGVPVLIGGLFVSWLGVDVFD